MPTLHISRIRLLAIETFKILHKMTPMYLQDLVSHKTCAYSFRYDNLIDLPRVRSMVNLLIATRPLRCGTAFRMNCAKSRTSVSLGGWSTHGVVMRANVLCVKVKLLFIVQFYFSLLHFCLAQ